MNCPEQSVNVMNCPEQKQDVYVFLWQHATPSKLQDLTEAVFINSNAALVQTSYCICIRM